MRIKIDLADKYFSKYIRTRDNWTCQRCKTEYPENSQGLHCSHYWNRWREGTRYEPDNCDALCFGCHKLWGSDERDEYTKFKTKQLGENRMKTLELQARSYCKKDRKLSLIIAKKLLEDLIK